MSLGLRAGKTNLRFFGKVDRPNASFFAQRVLEARSSRLEANNG